MRILSLWGRQFSDEIVEPLRSFGTVEWCVPSAAEVAGAIAGTDVLLASMRVRVDAELIRLAQRLRWVATPTTGLDHLDLEALQGSGVEVISLKGDIEFLGKITATAELAWGLVLAVVRAIPAASVDVRQGRWLRDKWRGNQLSGKTLGIIGVGRLGRMVAEYGRAFGMRVIGCNRSAFDCQGLEGVDLDTLLERAEVISVHVPLEAGTRHLLGPREFARMKRGMVLVNTSQGAVIDGSALLAALSDGTVTGAGLDVIEDERKEQLTDHPLIAYSRTHSNLIITPHIGGATRESQRLAYGHTATKLATRLKK